MDDQTKGYMKAIRGQGTKIREVRAALIQASPEADLVAACERWLEHYDSCVRDKFIGDEPGIPEMRRALKRMSRVVR